eukprot:CFRG5692T1
MTVALNHHPILFCSHSLVPQPHPHQLCETLLGLSAPSSTTPTALAKPIVGRTDRVSSSPLPTAHIKQIGSNKDLLELRLDPDRRHGERGFSASSAALTCSQSRYNTPENQSKKIG